MLSVIARRIIADERIHLPDAVLVGPLCQRDRILRNGHADAHEIGRHPGDRSGRGVHDHDRDLGLGCDVGNRHGVRRQVKSGQKLDMVLQHQSFGKLSCLVGAATGTVAVQIFDPVHLSVGSLDGMAVNCLVGLDRLLEL